MFMYNLYISTLKNTFSFNTPATKKEWFNFLIINITLTIIISYFGFNPEVYTDAATLAARTTQEKINIPQFAFMLALLPTSISIAYRRLVDTGSSKFLLLLFIIPLLGQLFALLFLSFKSSK